MAASSIRETLRDLGSEAQRLDEASLATTREGFLDLRARRVRTGEGELQPRQLEPHQRLGALQLPQRLGERTGRGTVIVRDLRVQAAECEVREGAAREGCGVPVGVLRRRDVAAELVDAPDALPDVARLRIEPACLLEQRAGSVEVAASHEQLALAGEDVLRPDGGWLGVGVQATALVERRRRGVEVAEVAPHAREVEEDLHLYAAPADALLGAGLLPHGARALERLDRFARAVQLLETVAAPEQTEMVGGEGDQRAIIPAQRLGPFLLALEVPADGAVKDRRASGRQLGAPQEVALHLVFVAEHAEGTPDLVEQIGGVPEVVLRGIVEAPVPGHDQVMLTAGRQEANLGEDRIRVAHPCVPSPRPAPQPSSTLPPVPHPIGQRASCELLATSS